MHYLAADKVINLANEVFGFNGWSTEIKQIQIDFVDENQSTGKISLGLSIVVRVTLKDGTFHEDIGYGQIDNCKGKAAAFMKAKKEAVTDGLKRALRNFGNVVGNCLYDKDFLQKVIKMKPPPAKWDPNKLHRHPSYRDSTPPKAAATGVPTEPLRSSRTESEQSKSTSADFEDDFEGNLFEGVEFDSGNPDEVVLDVTTDTVEVKQDDVKQGGPQVSDSRQGMNRVQSIPALKHHGGPPPAAPQSHQVKPPGAFPQPTRPSGVPNSIQRAQTEPNNAQRIQLQGHTGSGHSNVTPSNLNGRTTPVTDSNAPNEHVGFFTGRAVELVQNQGVAQATLPLNAPSFNPHSESPSIRRTNGVDHSKSLPINRSTLAPGNAPVASNTNPTPRADQRPTTRSNVVNPQADVNRRIGMPGAAQSPLANRAGYRPPAMQKRAVDGVPRPALTDVSNLQLDGSGDNGVDAKRPKLEP